MKTITKLLFVLCVMAFFTNAQAQNVTITNGFPYLIVNNTGTDDHGGIIWRNDGTNEGFTLYEMTTNKIQHQGGSAYQTDGSTNAFSIDLDRPNVNIAGDGYVVVGPDGGTRLTMDNNELQAKSGTTTSTLFLNFWGSNTLIGTGNTTGDLIVGSGNDLFVDNSANRVAIGTNSADQKLHVQHTGSDGIRIEGNDTGDSRLSINNGGGTHFIFDDDSDGHALDIQTATEMNFMTGTTERMTILSNGRVGIGTNTPAAQLEVGGDLYIDDASPLLRWQRSGVNEAEIIASATLLEMQTYTGDILLDANSGDMTFEVGSNLEAMHIATNGRVGIGTTNPLSDLHIADAGEVAGIICQRTDASNYVNLLSGTTGNSFFYARAKRFSISPSSTVTSTAPNVPNALFSYGPDWPTAAQAGNTGIGTDAPTEKLHVAGNLRVNSTVITSDRRLKSDIKDFKYGLDEVKKLNAVEFVYNGRGATTAGSKHVGLIAQELQAIAPELVEEFTHVLYEYDEDGTQREVGSEKYLQIRDTEVKYMLLNSIQELATENEAKDERINELETELDAMKEAIAQIQAKIAGSSTIGEATDAKLDVELNGTGDVAELAQNNPNPFNENTIIKYFLPEDATGAHMNIFSAEGKLLKAVKITETGSGQINLQANSLPAGNYMYQLVTDAGVVGSKTMVLAK